MPRPRSAQPILVCPRTAAVLSECMAPGGEVAADVVGRGGPVGEMAFGVQPRPRLRPGPGAVLEQVGHAPGVRADKGRQPRPLPGAQLVPIGHGAQPGPVKNRVAAVLQRHEPFDRVGQVPQPRAGTRAVPVDEHPPVRAGHQVPRRQVVVADKVGAVRRDGDVPPRPGRRREAGAGVVQVPDQPPDAVQARPRRAAAGRSPSARGCTRAPAVPGRPGLAAAAPR